MIALLLLLVLKTGDNFFNDENDSSYIVVFQHNSNWINCPQSGFQLQPLGCRAVLAKLWVGGRRGEANSFCKTSKQPKTILVEGHMRGPILVTLSHKNWWSHTNLMKHGKNLGPYRAGAKLETILFQLLNGWTLDMDIRSQPPHVSTEEYRVTEHVMETMKQEMPTIVRSMVNFKCKLYKDFPTS